MKKLILSLMLLAPMTLFAQKFGHFDSNAFMKTLPEAIAAQNSLEAKAKEYEKQLTEMQQELQTKADEYDKAKSTMSSTQQETSEKTLQDLYAKIQQAYQDNQKSLQEEQQKQLGPVVEKIRKALEQVAKTGGYVYIMEKEGGQPLYINEAISKNVESEVKAAYDKLK